MKPNEHIMAKLKCRMKASTHKEKKGAKYPYIEVFSDKGVKLYQKGFTDILVWNRSNTQTKQKQSAQSRKMIDALKKELKEKFDGLTYSKLNGVVTLEEHLNEVLHTKSDKTRSTQVAYRTAFKAITDFAMKSGYGVQMELNDIDVKFIDKFRIWLTEERQFKSSTAQSYFVALSTVMKKAKQWGYITENPFGMGVEYPKYVKQEMVYLTENEVTTLIKTPCKYQEIKNGFLFMCFTGIRKGDLHNLTWGDLPIINGEMHIKVLTEKSHRDIFHVIAPFTKTFIGKRMGDDDKVFNVNFTDKVNTKLRSWIKSAGINKHVVPRSARHTFAAFMLSKGTTLYQLAKLLGHASTRTTESKYGHLSKSNKDEAMRNAFGF